MSYALDMPVSREMGTQPTKGQRIRALREARKLPRRVVAERVKVTEETVRLWETDATSPRGANLLKLADLLGVSPGEIGDDSTAEERVAREDVYPSLAAFLDEFGEGLSEDEIEHLRGHKFKSGDPGPDYWPRALLRYQQQERSMRAQRPPDVAQEHPPIETGRKLPKRSKPPPKR